MELKLEFTLTLNPKVKLDPLLTGGYRYMKTGDESGSLCKNCDVPMFIIRTCKKRGWWEACRSCGRMITFVSWNTNPSVYR